MDPYKEKIDGMNGSAAGNVGFAIAAIYTTYGGLRSIAWADFLLGTALISVGSA